MSHPQGHVFFVPSQLTPAGLAEPGVQGWWVDGMGVSYRGRVTAPQEWDAVRVCQALNALAQQVGHNVCKGRLYSRTWVGDQ